MFAAINTFLSGGASAPLNTVAPAVTGTAAAGQTLSCTTGTWTGSLPITYTYQWQHGTTNIASATSSTYVLDRSYIGETIRCVVTATNAIGAPTANSNATSAVVAVPLNTVAPAVTGTATNGQTLSCSTGTWTGTATITYAYQWKRAGSNVGSNSSTYVLGDADVGSVMSCVVTGTNGQGSATGTSNSTGAVAAIAPGVPTGVSATATSYSTATVYFSAPSSNGGAAITNYTTNYGGSSAGGSISITGLSGSSSYTFYVYAQNSVGQGPASAASNAITTPVTPPTTIGQAFGGGYYAGKISTSANGVATHYLIVSPKASGFMDNTTPFFYYRADPSSDIDGPTNTTTIHNTYPGAATTFVRGLSIGGYSDWYIPAICELMTLYYHLKPYSFWGNEFGVGRNDGYNPYAVAPYTANAEWTYSDPPMTSAVDFQYSGGSWHSEAIGPEGGNGRILSSTHGPSGVTVRTVDYQVGRCEVIGGTPNQCAQPLRAIRRVAI